LATTESPKGLHAECFYEPDADELDELNAMVERDASKDEIILWLHKRADEIMWNDELP
jgi:hypothetical protein